METQRDNFVLEKRKVIVDAYNKIIDVKIYILRSETNKKRRKIEVEIYEIKRRKIEVEIYEIIHTIEEV